MANLYLRSMAITDSFHQRASRPSCSIASSIRPSNLAPSKTPTSRASSSVFTSPYILFPISPLSILTPELALQHIEAQTTLVLSRQIGTPNIASKGKPRSRRVLVPAALYPPDHSHHRASLVQEIPDRSTSVLEKGPSETILPETRIPAWSWTQQGSRIRIVFDVPGVVSKPSPPPARCI